MKKGNKVVEVIMDLINRALMLFDRGASDAEKKHRKQQIEKWRKSRGKA